MVQTATDLPQQAMRVVTSQPREPRALDVVGLQQNLLRFADGFSTVMILTVDELRRGGQPLDSREALSWKIALTTEICSIVSAPSAVGGLLDMTVWVTVMRQSLEEYWQPEVFGEASLPMLQGCRNAEAEIWELAERVLDPAQQAELRQSIQEWRRRNPLPKAVLAARALGLASRLAEANRASNGSRGGSVFSLLMLDPLSGLDPATREIAEARLLAERALFVTQKMPQLMRWQSELLAVNALDMPAIRQWRTNSAQLVESVERFAGVAERLPDQLSAEREQILRGLESQEKELMPLVREVRQALLAGSGMSTSLTTTLGAFDALMQRFGVGETNASGAAGTDSEPFRIQDYGRTAEQLEAAAQRLTELLVAFDRTLGSTNLLGLSAQVGPVVQQAQAGGRDVVDYAFRKGLILLACVLGAALLYRVIAVRLGRVTG